MTDKMREAFEKWAERGGHSVAKYELPNNNDYWSDFTQLAWEAWQAAQAEQSAELERLRDITRTVAARLLHTLPMGAVCTCSRCELIQEARAAIVRAAAAIGEGMK